MPNRLQNETMVFTGEPGNKALVHLLRDIPNSERHTIQELFKAGEDLLSNIAEILQVLDEGSSGFRVFDGFLSRDIWLTATSPASLELFIVDCRAINLHRIALQVQFFVIDNMLPHHGTKDFAQEFAVPGGLHVGRKELVPERVAAQVLMERIETFNFLSGRARE